MESKHIYREVQAFATWWLGLLLALFIGFLIYYAIVKNGGNITFGIGMFIGVGVVLLIFLTRLHSRVDTEGIHIRFFPFVWKEKSWRWEDIEKVYVRKYSVWEYGGWGYRFNGAGIAYNTKGIYGIQLVLKRKGARILIGTQNPKEVEEVLKQYQLINKDNEA